jgi:hypothetical protein
MVPLSNLYSNEYCMREFDSLASTNTPIYFDAFGRGKAITQGANLSCFINHVPLYTSAISIRYLKKHH